MHPRTQKCLEHAALLQAVRQHCVVIEPVGYVEMLQILRRCVAVVTDSGGLQKEAFYCGKRCLVLRDTTEWTELVARGYTRLCSLNQPGLKNDVLAWLGQTDPLTQDLGLYGGGKASAGVANAIAQRYMS